MDFIRKNWSRLSLALLYLIGGVIAVVAWVNNPFGIVIKGQGVYSFFNIAVLISTILYFFGMVAITIVKSLTHSKKIVSAIYMAVGGIITVLLVVLLAVGSFNEFELVSIAGNAALYSFYLYYIPLIIFGLYPLIKGVTRFIEAETVPAKAPVAPATAPAAETAPAEAPKKAPVKKAAK